MSSKPIDHYHGAAQPCAEAISGRASGDFGDSYIVYALTVVIGFYLFITVLLWRGGLWLLRRLLVKGHGVSSPRKTLWQEAAKHD